MKRRGVNISNKGFTLIETIVAMTIMVLVAVPLMDTFSRSMVVTTKTSRFQRAVLLGQSITEGIKAHSIYDLCQTFTQPTKYHFDILDGHTFDVQGYERLKLKSGTIKKFESYSATAKNDKIYYYGIYGASNGAKSYDALITVDSNEYDDINSRIIPTIVNMGSKSTAVIDNTGVLSHLDDLVKAAKDSIGATDLKCVMDVYIKKFFDYGVDDKGGGYYVYADVTYSSISNPSKKITYRRVGDKAFDKVNKLQYIYVICNAQGLKTDSNSGQFNYVNFHVTVEDNDPTVDIPVALVTSNTTNTCKWIITGDGNHRKYIQFLTNNGETGISNMYDVASGSLENFGNSGQKIRRLYGLTVEIYEHQASLESRFIGSPIVATDSTLLR